MYDASTDAEQARVTFPVYLWLGPVGLHPHLLLEVLSYVVGSWLYQALKAHRGDSISPDHRWSVVAAAAVGAAVGGKLLYLASDFLLTLEHGTDLAHLIGGKSIVGALVGGLIAVEAVKWRMGVTRSTGDLFVLPLCMGIAIGRIGCFLTGIDDHTHGLPTDLPWAVDFGDGAPRHPTQLYEVVFLALLGLMCWWVSRRLPGEGDLFKLFMVCYMGFRLALEFIKPGVAMLGLNAIQWVALGTLVYYARMLVVSAFAHCRLESAHALTTSNG